VGGAVNAIASQTGEQLRSLVNAALELHTDRQDGAQALSFVSQELRYAHWRGASNLNELESNLKRLGYTVVNERGQRFVRPIRVKT
jgi:hypothetical protein